MAAYRAGDIVWAKIRGFPFWPATVQNPTHFDGLKMPKKQNLYYVKFIDVADKEQFAWVASKDMVDFLSNLEIQQNALERKRGQRYTALKKCIAIGVEAHKNYMEVLTKNQAKLLKGDQIADLKAGPSHEDDAAKAKNSRVCRKSKSAVSTKKNLANDTMEVLTPEECDFSEVEPAVSVTETTINNLPKNPARELRSETVTVPMTGKKSVVTKAGLSGSGSPRIPKRNYVSNGEEALAKAKRQKTATVDDAVSNKESIMSNMSKSPLKGDKPVPSGEVDNNTVCIIEPPMGNNHFILKWLEDNFEAKASAAVSRKFVRHFLCKYYETSGFVIPKQPEVEIGKRFKEVIRGATKSTTGYPVYKKAKLSENGKAAYKRCTGLELNTVMY